jgi:hypothetical protein
VQNSYSRAYSLKVILKVRNFFGVEVARSKQLSVQNLESKEVRTINLETTTKIGQWGAYSAVLTIVPPQKIDTFDLQEINRTKDFFVLPVVPGSILMILLALELLRRFFWIKFGLGLRFRKSLSASESEK